MKAIDKLQSLYPESNRRTLVENDVVHIDLQGKFPKDNKRYANIQVQLNSQKCKNIHGKKTSTIAIVCVEIDYQTCKELIGIQYVKDALKKSLNSEQEEYWLTRRI